MKQWTVYILQCKDATLYTGITCDLSRRLLEHSLGQGAKYTRGRGPLVQVYGELCPDKRAALRRELEIKKLSREKKLELCRLFEANKAEPLIHGEIPLL